MSLMTYGCVEILDYSGEWRAAILLTPRTFPGTDHRTRKFLYDLADGQGMPKDASHITRKLYNDLDVNSAQWIRFSKLWIDWNSMHDSWIALINCMNELSLLHGQDKIRLIFWSE